MTHMDMAHRILIVTWIALMLAGCATRNAMVRCDGHLEPINTLAPNASRSGVAEDTEAADLASRSRE